MEIRILQGHVWKLTGLLKFCYAHSQLHSHSSPPLKPLLCFHFACCIGLCSASELCGHEVNLGRRSQAEILHDGFQTSVEHCMHSLTKLWKKNLSENQFGNIYCELNLFFHYLDKIGHLFVISISWDGYNPGWVGKNRETLGDYIKSDCKWGYMNDCPTL